LKLSRGVFQCSLPRDFYFKISKKFFYWKEKQKNYLPLNRQNDKQGPLPKIYLKPVPLFNAYEMKNVGIHLLMNDESLGCFGSF